MAVVGHHTPCVFLIFCYIKVAVSMRRRAKIRPKVKGVNESTTAEISYIPATSYVMEDGNTYEQETVMENTETAAPAHQHSLAPPPENNHDNEDIQGRKAKYLQKKRIESHHDKEGKIFVTMSYIVLSYLACWVPFHIVFDCSAINPDLVPEPLYTATFWLTYFNSTLNPFLYAYSSKEFRVAFSNVLKCCCRKQKLVS